MKSITIVAIAGNKIEEHVAAIERTKWHVPYPCETLLISPQPSVSKIRHIHMEDFGTDKSKYFNQIGEITLRNLASYINTEFCILVQTDGYAVNKNAWTDEFFDWDYIGAPWPIWELLTLRGSMFHRVGSGGFCLRSHKFLDASVNSPSICTAGPKSARFAGEDVSTPRIHYKYFENLGCRFAPTPIALKWCIEHSLEDYPHWKPSDSFGHHGFYGEEPMYSVSPVRAFYFTLKKSLKHGRLTRFNIFNK
jgi:hypothetical protein